MKKKYSVSRTSGDSFVERLKKDVERSRTAQKKKRGGSEKMAELHQALQKCHVLSGKIHQATTQSDDVLASKQGGSSKTSEVRLGKRVPSIVGGNTSSDIVASDGVMVTINPLDKKIITSYSASRIFSLQKTVYSRSLPVVQEVDEGCQKLT